MKVRNQYLFLNFLRKCQLMVKPLSRHDNMIELQEHPLKDGSQQQK